MFNSQNPLRTYISLRHESPTPPSKTHHTPPLLYLSIMFSGLLFLLTGTYNRSLVVF